MAKDKAQDHARRLLSLWEPPADAGKPVGVLATTFTLDTGVFEEECLARFVGVQSDPYRDGAIYRIEREEKLSSLICAAVVTDIHHCSGQRSLRWDLIPSRPASGVMHAKISLLAWEKHLRVLIGSANLTGAGYRRNQECAALLDFEGLSAEEELLAPILAFLREILDTTSGVGLDRALKLLDWVSEKATRLPSPKRGLRRRFIPIGPGKPNAFDQMDVYLPPTRPTEAHVVSPFFDQTARDFGPVGRLWEMLRQRGGARLHLHVGGTFASEIGKWRLQVPGHLLESAVPESPTRSWHVHPIAVTQVQTEAGAENRPLHAKSLTLSHPAWVAWMVGSSNFTSAGLGIKNKKGPHVVNYEANVLYYFIGDAANPLHGKIASGGHRGTDHINWKTDAELSPETGEEDGEGELPPPLPAFFKGATLMGGDEQGYVVELHVTPSPKALPTVWQVRSGTTCVFDSVEWTRTEQPSSWQITLERHGPPPSSLVVDWQSCDKTHTADWPVNVDVSAVLPAPAELRDLSLAALLDLLSSARPLYEIIRGWQRRQVNDDDSDGFSAADIVDPHQKVDTSGFLVKRVQRACAAISYLRKRLEDPLLSEAALAWRLEGPVGARAVMAAIRRECREDLPDEWTFLLSEMLRELRSVVLTVPGGARAPAALQARLRDFVDELSEELVTVASGASPQVQQLARSIIEEPVHATA